MNVAAIKGADVPDVQLIMLHFLHCIYIITVNVFKTCETL